MLLLAGDPPEVIDVEAGYLPDHLRRECGDRCRGYVEEKGIPPTNP
ncbi:MAG: hypothetical protein QCI82_07260 [Candidatus Thermoplasmatota archaeon]|nr:hypothetical protein [Candidatus Thermoplasmatota archaeon]